MADPSGSAAETEEEAAAAAGASDFDSLSAALALAAVFLAGAAFTSDTSSSSSAAAAADTTLPVLLADLPEATDFFGRPGPRLATSGEEAREDAGEAGVAAAAGALFSGVLTAAAAAVTVGLPKLITGANDSGALRLRAGRSLMTRDLRGGAERRGDATATGGAEQSDGSDRVAAEQRCVGLATTDRGRTMARASTPPV